MPPIGREPHRYTRGEELASSLTHGIGTALSVVGFAVVVAATLTMEPR